MFTLTANDFFDKNLPAVLAHPAAGAFTEVVEFQIEDRGQSWLVDFGKKSIEQLKKGQPSKPKAIVRARERDFLALVDGRMSPEDGVLTQRLHVAGDVVTLARLMSALAAVHPPGGPGGPKATAAPTPTATPTKKAAPAKPSTPTAPNKSTKR